MRYAVLHTGIPVGAVELPTTELTAGRLERSASYGAIEARVRAASEALLAFGLYGPCVSPVADEKRRIARFALRAGAALRLELRQLPSGASVHTTFVSLIEAPDDRNVVVVARFREMYAGVPASLIAEPRAGEGHHDPVP